MKVLPALLGEISGETHISKWLFDNQGDKFPELAKLHERPVLGINTLEEFQALEKEKIYKKSQLISRPYVDNDDVSFVAMPNGNICWANKEEIEWLVPILRASVHANVQYIVGTMNPYDALGIGYHRNDSSINGYEIHVFHRLP